MCEPAAYDSGYASIDANRRVGANAHWVSPSAPVWAPATIKLHLGWLSRQLRVNPEDDFRWGRYDALCDVLATFEPVMVRGGNDLLLGLKGRWLRDG
ncbi:MAG: hypothetical protein ACREFO_05900 [Acetobacteraceae bacterium]